MLACINAIILLLQFVTSHFVISYPENVQMKKIEILADYLEGRYNILSAEWKLENTKKIDVVFYSSTYDFLKYSESQAGMSGKYLNGRIHFQPILLLEKKGILKSVISHELAHAFLYEYAKAGLPDWLNESFAIYFSGEIKRYKPLKKLNLYTFEDLGHYLKSNDLKIKNSLYFYLGLTMQFFINTYQKEKCSILLKSFGTGVEDPFYYAFQKKKENIEKNWKTYLSGFNR